MSWKDEADEEWHMVTRRRHRNTDLPPIKKIIEAETAASRLDDKCTENHPECIISRERLCVYKIRARIPCRFEKQRAGSCPRGEDCTFNHDLTANASNER